MYTRKLGKRKKRKSRKRYSRKAGVLNRPSNMANLQVQKPFSTDNHFGHAFYSPGQKTKLRNFKSKAQLLKDLTKLIKIIEIEKDEERRKIFEEKLATIAQLIAEYHRFNND